MLPFLKNKDRSIAGLIIKTRAPDENPDAQESEENDGSAAIESCAQELIDAVHNRDIKAVASALKSAFDILESMPHEEAEMPQEDEGMSE